jgi:hypothetical protein
MTTFSPLRYIDGYLPIEDHGLIGDGTTAALVGRDGAITWLCVPRFDSPPLFCGILGATQGGSFKVAPDGVTESRQFYEPDTGVLVTELRGSSALVRVLMPLPSASVPTWQRMLRQAAPSSCARWRCSTEEHAYGLKWFPVEERE